MSADQSSVMLRNKYRNEAFILQNAEGLMLSEKSSLITPTFALHPRANQLIGLVSFSFTALHALLFVSLYSCSRTLDLISLRCVVFAFR